MAAHQRHRPCTAAGVVCGCAAEGRGRRGEGEVVATFLKRFCATLLSCLLTLWVKCNIYFIGWCGTCSTFDLYRHFWVDCPRPGNNKTSSEIDISLAGNNKMSSDISLAGNVCGGTSALLGTINHLLVPQQVRITTPTVHMIMEHLKPDTPH